MQTMPELHDVGGLSPGGAARERQTRGVQTTPGSDPPVQAVLDLERLATLGTLAGGIGHELSNVVSVLVSAAEGIEHAAKLGLPPEEEDLAHMRRALDHVRIHVRGLAHLGKPVRDSDKVYNLCEVVAESVSMLERTGRALGARVTVETCAPAKVTVNRTRIEQVVLNLVGNACDAFAQSKRPTSERYVHISVVPTVHGRVRVSIQDNGSGIPPLVLERIFEPYFTTKPSGKGTGLGLPVCREILEQYGSKLEVETRDGEGTRFSFELPLAREG